MHTVTTARPLGRAAASRLVDLGSRMLGDIGAAEDVVQDGPIGPQARRPDRRMASV